jgi:hypothetical protein
VGEELFTERPQWWENRREKQRAFVQLSGSLCVSKLTSIVVEVLPFTQVPSLSHFHLIEERLTVSVEDSHENRENQR